VTIETTLSEISESKLAILRQAGVNRISCGVQSFDTAVRQGSGRVYNGKEVQEAIQMIAGSGITNLAIDLIYSLDGHSEAVFGRDLELVKALPVSGCSVYPLITSVPQSAPVADLKMELQRHLMADRTLRDLAGWKRFTPVQYGHAIEGRAVYVQSHGLQGDVMAFGPSAGSKTGMIGFLQTRDTEAWMQQCRAGVEPLEMLVQYHPGLDSLRKVFRLSEADGLETAEADALRPVFGELFDLLEEGLLIQQHDGRLHLTPSGAFWAGNISALFAARISELLR
jgi:oxygen-independent coproporphyrinogen-3 oxidase